MIYLLAACLALLASVLALQVVFQARAIERDRAAFSAERQEWAAERRDLNNRIQVPQAAPFMGVGETAESTPQFVPFDDDDAFQANKENGWQS